MLSGFQAHKITIIFIYLFIFAFVHCKLDLNNPSDSKSKSYFETAAMNTYLRTICSPLVRGNVRIGSGNYLVLPQSLLSLKNGNYIITASVSEPILWSGRSDGINHSYTGVIGTDPFIVIFQVNGRTFEIEWLDYLGHAATTSSNRYFSSLSEFSNGEIGIFTQVTGTEQAGAISGKLNSDSFMVARYSPSGSRVWFTYLDMAIGTFNIDKIAHIVDSKEQIHLFYTSIGTAANTPNSVGITEFPAPTVASNGLFAGQKEIGWAILNGSGIPQRQRFLRGASDFEVISAIYTKNDTILLGGSALNQIENFSGHPALNQPRGFSAFLSSNTQDVIKINYLGSSDSTFTVGKLEAMTLGNDGIYGTGVAAGSYGFPIHDYQFYPAGNFRNYSFVKFDLNGNLLWNQFLGSSTTNVIDLVPALSYISYFDEIRVKLLGTEAGTRMTGLDSISYGSGINPYQDVTLRINGRAGRYNSIRYETNILVTNPVSGLIGLNVDIQDACNGRMVSLKRFLYFPATIGYLEFSTKPPMEEP
ncbi:hypothetical protein EHR01_12435 [Leptospira mtsangambouensis]|uniref:Uncharacterized protein n=1 Tax=Leptospira mtsangambouensis TaxID=2484912 RepID=A0ABY2NUB9_9LEPT|nr:hypothetical protein [Leptospira mtsangambouensis]TGM72088.1 hypothetical protein EHR01_12435 [Leptospira mtsangambouensis]